MKSLKILLLAIASFTLMQANANDVANEKIRARIAPVGQACVTVDCGAAASNTGVAAAASAAGRSGETIYNKSCVACHGSGLLDAPKKGDTAAWDARFAQGEDTVLKHAIGGLNAMPPKGTCGDCSDDELLSAIKFMAGR